MNAISYFPDASKYADIQEREKKGRIGKSYDSHRNLTTKLMIAKHRNDRVDFLIGNNTYRVHKIKKR